MSMGNNLAFLDDELDDELTVAVDPRFIINEQLTNALGDMVGLVNHFREAPENLPVIRKKPDLRAFRQSDMYKEIKAMCGLPATCRAPSDRWSLERGLQKRENGMAGNINGSFTANQQRSIANLYVPNQKQSRLMSLESKVFVSKFNKDGSKLITACQDSLIRLFDSSKGTYHLINRIKAKDVNWSILDVDFSPCGKFFAYSTWYDYFFLLPTNSTGEEFTWLDLNITQNRVGIFSLRFSPCGKTLIGGCNNSCIYLCDIESRRVKKIRTHRHGFMDINAVSYVSDQDSNVIVCGSNGGTIKLYDTRCYGRTNMPASTFLGHLDGITYIDTRNDGRYLLSNSKDQSIRVWDLRQPTPSRKVNKHSDGPLYGWDYRWDSPPIDYYNNTNPIDGDVSLMTLRGHRVTKSLLRAKFSPAQQTGQRYIYTGCGTGRIVIYDVLTGQVKEAIEGHKYVVRDLDWHPVRSEIVSSSWDSHVNLNTFKRNLLLKRSSSEQSKGPLRRSRRIATRKGELDENEVEDDEPQRRW